MAVINRLSFLIGSLDDTELSRFEKQLDPKTDYAKLYNKIKDGLKIETIGHKKSVKNLDDQADYLLNKILDFFAKNPTNELSNNLIEFNKILFLRDHEIDDVAERIAHILIPKIAGKEGHYWLYIALYEHYFNSPHLWDNSLYLSKLFLFTKQLQGYYDESSLQLNAPIDFVRFIEKFKKELTDIKLKRDLLWLEYRNVFHDFGDLKLIRSYQILFELLNLYNNYSHFLFDSEEVRKNAFIELEIEFVNFGSHNFISNTTNLLQNYFALNMFQEFQLLGAVNNYKAKGEFKNWIVITEEVADNVIFRIEINQLLIKIINYEPILDRNQNQLKKFINDLVKLIEYSNDNADISALLKSIYIILISKNKDIVNSKSTMYNYVKDLETSELVSYSKGKINVKSDNRMGQYLNVLINNLI